MLNHARNACFAALEMSKRIAVLNSEREQEARARGETFLPLRIGIGVNTGTCVVGNMGSDLRFNYTVLGDAVNLTSRIEGQTKTYGVTIMAGARTLMSAGDDFAAIELDVIRVKGKSEPEVVHGLFGASDVATSESFRDLCRSLRQMLTCYRGQDWTKALDALDACRAFETEYELTALFDLYASRIRKFHRGSSAEPIGTVFTASRRNRDGSPSTHSSRVSKLCSRSWRAIRVMETGTPLDQRLAPAPPRPNSSPRRCRHLLSQIERASLVAR